MKVMVSACLLGENVKYNGGNNRSERLLRLLEGHEVVSVCPEVLGGLPIPRTPAEIVSGRVQMANGISADREFRLGARRALEIAEREMPELVILQSRSPSCGAREVYDGTFSGRKIPGMGVTAELLQSRGFRIIDSGDPGEIEKALCGAGESSRS